MNYSIDTKYFDKGYFNSIVQKVINDIQFYLEHLNFPENTYNGVCLDYVFWWIGADIENHYNRTREDEKIPLLFEEALYNKLIYTPYLKKYCIDQLLYCMYNTNKVDMVYDIIDDKSKGIFEWLLKRKLAYALTGELSFEMYPCNFEVSAKAQPTVDEYGRYHINDYIIDSDAFTDIWCVEQYSLHGLCEPQEGDIVLSAGAYKGETAIWFSDKIGPNGHVYSFEPDENNQNILLNNLNLNNIANVTLVKEGLWNRVGKQMFENNGALSMVVTDSCATNNAREVIVDTIDHFVSAHNISAVDFIKMDIEGGEFYVLQGAIDTIKKYRPKLAISIYHSARDFIEIPLLIHNLVPEYKMSISHKKTENVFTETILFAYI